MALFITFEGPDGSGKSTQARLLAEWLREQGHDVLATREPGGTALGDALRTLALSPTSPTATPLALALVMCASRAQLVAEVIRPALATGQIVISDRYAESTVAYQGYGLGVDLAQINTLNAIATGGLRPDVIVYVDVSAEVGLERTAARGRRDRLDDLTVDFHQRVRAGYQEQIAAEPARWRVVDGDAAPQDVQAAIVRAIEPNLPHHR